MTDVLLAALGLAVADRRARHGETGGGLLVALEGHGRQEQLAPGIDLSRTVGWFTSLFPVCADPGAAGEFDVADALCGGPAAIRAVEQVRDEVAAVPDGGIGFGLLRQLNPRTGPLLTEAGMPQVEFNYLGRFARPDDADWAIAAETDAVDIAVDPQMPHTFALSVVARTEDRPVGPVLRANWIWPRAVLPRELVEDLADTWVRALDAITAAAQSRG